MHIYCDFNIHLITKLHFSCIAVEVFLIYVSILLLMGTSNVICNSEGAARAIIFHIMGFLSLLCSVCCVAFRCVCL